MRSFFFLILSFFWFNMLQQRFNLSRVHRCIEGVTFQIEPDLWLVQDALAGHSVGGAKRKTTMKQSLCLLVFDRFPACANSQVLLYLFLLERLDVRALNVCLFLG